MVYSAGIATQYNKGDLVILSGGRIGTVRWKGYPKGSVIKTATKLVSNYLYGVELTGFGKGGSDGTYLNKRYFKCAPGRAVFTGRKDIVGKPYNTKSRKERLAANRRRSSVLIASTIGDLSRAKEEMGPSKSKWKVGDKVGVYCCLQNIWFEDGEVTEVSEDGTRVLVKYQKDESSRWLDDLDLENHLRQPGPTQEEEAAHSWERPAENLPDEMRHLDMPAPKPWDIYSNYDQVQTMHPHIKNLSDSINSKITGYSPQVPAYGGGGDDYQSPPPAEAAPAPSGPKPDIRVGDAVKTYFKAKGGERSPYQDPATVMEIDGDYCIVKFENDQTEQEVPLSWVDYAG